MISKIYLRSMFNCSSFSRNNSIRFYHITIVVWYIRYYWSLFI